jgi:hypothetical protein
LTKGTAFLLKILIVGFCLVIADAGIGRLMRHYYFRVNHGEQARVNRVVDSATDSVLVLGSSRAAHHYISSIISDSLQFPCWNAGKDRQGLFYNLAIAKMVLLRYHPRGIILDLSPASFIAGESGLDDLSVLLPYYRQHPEIRAIVNRMGPWEWVKTRSALYCYNSLALQIVFNNLPDTRDSGIINGYIPNYNMLNRTPVPPYTAQQTDGSPDTAIVASFEEMITLAEDGGTGLAVIISPVYFPMPAGTSTIRLAKEICARRQVLFLDYSASDFIPEHTSAQGASASARIQGSATAPSPRKADFFSDENHLNDAGARIFTPVLCSDLIAKGFGRKNE